MRLFIAVEIDRAVREAAVDIASRVRRRIEARGRRLAPAGVTWVKADNLHLTLRFLGEVDDALAESVREAIAAPFRGEPFEGVLAGLGMFPPSGRPRVLWIGTREGEPRLVQLAEEVESRIEALGFQREARPFRGHLTLARFREPAAVEVRREAQIEDAVAGRSKVGEVVLFQSRLSPKGPTYTALARGRIGVGTQDS